MSARLPPTAWDRCAGARQAGAIFVIVGAFGLLSGLDPHISSGHPGITTATGILTLAVGLFSRTRYVALVSGRRALAMPVIALAGVAATNATGVVPPAALGLFFVMIFLWIGQWHPPGTGLWFVPLAALAYLLPFTLGAPRTFGIIPSVVFVVGGAALAGETLARQTRAVKRARGQEQELLQTLERAGKRDDLTGLGNRRLGNTLLDSLTADDAIALLDLDHFKRVNDTLGHATGDQLLQEFGAFLNGQGLAQDTIARMGGEEFLIVFPNTSQATVIPIVQRLLEAWQSTSPLATFSAGISFHSQQSPAVTYAEADRALYEAKLAGRNRLRWSPKNESFGRDGQSAQQDNAKGLRESTGPLDTKAIPSPRP